MSILSELDRISQNIKNAYAAAKALGADMPSDENSDNLTPTILSSKPVLYAPQTLTAPQQTQARQNIGAIAGYNVPWVSVIDYGAVGDGATDDTAAFQTALAANRGVFVPGGTYKLSGTLVIGQNCCLELSQDTVLNSTQTSGNCIELRSSATLRGNHAVIIVPYAFAGNAIALDADYDGTNTVPPYLHWDPMWKHGRYVYDVCIVKPHPTGYHYSYDGTCSGTALYMHTDGTKALPYMWGVNASGIRIAGAFTYGINVVNVDDPNDNTDDDAWNHDMRIEAVIQGCETSVAMTNCNAAYLSVTIQPSSAENGNKYAKWGVYLNDCKYVDMSSSRVWDWGEGNTLLGTSKEYQHIALYGNCQGLILSDFHYYGNPSTDIREQIYTDTPSNLEKMTILQEPITRWFKVKNGKPYYTYDGYDKKLATDEELAEYFDTNVVKAFEDVLSSATDLDGSIYNGVGYEIGNGYIDTSGNDVSGNVYYGRTGFIKAKTGDTVYVQGIKYEDLGDAYDAVSFYNADKGFVQRVPEWHLITNGMYYYADSYVETEDGFSFRIVSSGVEYIRFSNRKTNFGTNPMVSINAPIKYVQEGFLADGVKVKGDNIYVYSPSGQAFKLTINDSGVLTPVKLES